MGNFRKTRRLSYPGNQDCSQSPNCEANQSAVSGSPLNCILSMWVSHSLRCMSGHSFLGHDLVAHDCVISLFSPTDHVTTHPWQFPISCSLVQLEKLRMFSEQRDGESSPFPLGLTILLTLPSGGSTAKFSITWPWTPRLPRLHEDHVHPFLLPSRSTVYVTLNWIH